MSLTSRKAALHKGKVAVTKGRAAKQEMLLALKRAGLAKARAIFRYRGQRLAVVTLRDLRLLERLIEQEEDRQDIEEAERRLADPAERPIPYAEARRRLGLSDLHD